MNANSKQIRQAVVNHIGEHTSPKDYGVETWKEVIRKKVEDVKEPGEYVHSRTAGARQVQGGSFLVYNGDVEEFLLSLHYTAGSICMRNEETRWEQYQQLIGRGFYDILSEGYTPE